MVADLPPDTQFDHLWLEEALVAGQRIRRHQVLIDGAVIAEGTTVGATRIHLVGPQRAGRLEIELRGESARLRGLSVHRTGITNVEPVPMGYLAPTEPPEH